jgi:hypothetical protein
MSDTVTATWSMNAIRWLTAPLLLSRAPTLAWFRADGEGGVQAEIEELAASSVECAQDFSFSG